MYNKTNPIVAYVPGGYKPNFIPVVIGREQDHFDFDRNTTALRRQKDGLLVEMPIDVPRLNYQYKNNCPYLLLEPQATNLLPYSEQFNQSSWTKTGLSITTTEIIAPDGNKTGNKLKVSSSGKRYAADNVTLVNNEKAQISCFAKAGLSGWFALECVDAFGPTTDEAIGTFDLVNGKVGTAALSQGVTPELSIEPYNNGWYRCIMTFTATSSGAWNARIIASAQSETDLSGGTQDFVYAWGAQAEVSQECTSYIPTGATITTRVSDKALNGLSYTTLPSAEAGLYLEFEHTADPISGFRTITLHNGSNDFVKIQQSGSAGNLNVIIKVKGTTEVSTFFDILVGQRNKLAVTWGINRECRIFLNGEQIQLIKPINTFLPGELRLFNFATESQTLNYYGKIYDMRLYDLFAFNMASDDINTFFETLTN
ncbi:MAG: hypothetical protein Unbinned92contig1002_37 [Prokaryotic dsDNA virus sp.]|nr:MAG: hypothetical protein Unbinned92contig1002_37 [Prokaryotic dsDNA virus sp.]|tara:strand:- start:4510 stop:5787 length:1278 start_codon:yes stop_codon:yes gene_type:complete